MGTEQQARRLIGQIAGDDVGALQGGAVVAFECGLLTGDGHAVLLELGCDPLATGIMGRTVHGARAKVALLLTELIGAVGDKHRTYGFQGGVGI